MALVIVEAPKKIAKIKKCLGKEFQVESSAGHIMDLKKEDMGIKFPELEPVYEVYKDKRDIVKHLKAEAKKHDDIYIATDADREGEAIAYNILSILPKRGKNIYRVVFRSINKTEIQANMKNPIGFNEDVFLSQQARRMIDRLVGFKVSPLMWTKGLKHTSAGRVQSSALKFIVDREKEIRAFVKEEYWSIQAETKLDFAADFFAKNGRKYVPKNEKQAKDIVDDIRGDLEVTKFEQKMSETSPPKPFETSTLQQVAGSRFGWTGQKVMDTAQNLYANGLITYHRTDSLRCDPEKVKLARDKIEKKFGKNYLSPKPMVYGASKDAQDAHEAIRPTFDTLPATMMDDERKLYNLIRDRFFASQMASASFAKTQMVLDYEGKSKYSFKATGSILKFDGFLKVYGGTKDDKLIPAVKKGQKIPVKKLLPKQHFTKAPPRYTGPSLTSKVKKEGIGRPSTYASIAEHLIKRGYVNRQKNTLFATEVGIMVCDYLEAFFDKLTSAGFTSDMESRLDKVAAGELEMKKVVKDFLDILEEDIEKAKKGDAYTVFLTDTECSSCADGSKMAKKIGKHGVFLGCQNYPKCGRVINFGEDGKMVEDEIETGEACPECNSKVRKIKAKYGVFYGCSSYPVCEWKGKLNSEGTLVSIKKAETTDIKCPECKTNNLSKRKGRNGEFFGCSGYPKCKYTANIGEDGQPIKSEKKKKNAPKSTGKTCPKCKKNELVERTGRYGKFVACSGYPKCKHIEKEK